MSHIVPEEIEAYAEQHTTEPVALFHELATETREKMEHHRMQVGKVEGGFLRLLVRMVNAKLIVEIGTFTGYSALCMAEGMAADGKLITCDVDPEATAIAQAHWNQSPHGATIELRIGPALETLDTIDGPIDMVFIDADKENYINYWEAALPKVRQGGLIVADNVLWSGRVLKPEKRSDHAVAQFNKHVVADARVEAVMLTVRDGVTLAWKR
jgi:caffeoyl-CoA O-methyltransferase